MAAPEVLWLCTRPDGSEARCVLVPGRPVNTVVWYLNDVVQGVQDFDDADEARHWAVSALDGPESLRTIRALIAYEDPT